MLDQVRKNGMKLDDLSNGMEQVIGALDIESNIPGMVAGDADGKKKYSYISYCC